MKKLILTVLLMLLMTTGCGKETQTDAKEYLEPGTYKEVLVESSPGSGSYEVELQSVSEEEIDYYSIGNSKNEKYYNETLPPLLQKVTDETGITFKTSLKGDDVWKYIKVEIYRNGNTMSNYELRCILPNLNSYNKEEFVPGIDIKYIQVDATGERVSLRDSGYWDENGEFIWQ